MRKSLSTLVLLLSLALPSTLVYAEDEDANFDRLDGTGPSGKKVNVIEWEGNLEIHVYPKGGLKGLALKLDKTKSNPVMVIGYRFDNEEVLIRRAVLGIDLQEGFKTYRDSSADDYDKVIITNNGLSAPLVAYNVDPEPTQLYPDGHPENANREIAGKRAKKGKNEVRDLAKTPPTIIPQRPKKDETETSDEKPTTTAENKSDYDDDGRIRPFFFNREGVLNRQGRLLR